LFKSFTLLLLISLTLTTLSCGQSNNSEVKNLKTQVAALEKQKLQNQVNELEKELSKEQDSKPKSDESPKAKSTESSKPKTIESIIYTDKKYEPFNRYLDMKNHLK